jgi:predicted GNAT family N-acyltransferase
MNINPKPTSLPRTLFDIEGTDLKMKMVTTAFEGMTVSYIRFKVFVEEQKVPIDDEMDGSDSVAISFLMFKNNIPIGTIRYIKMNDKTVHPGRIAVLKAYRGQGYGTKMIRWLHAYLKAMVGNVTIEIHAQAHLQAYYKKLGYLPQGKVFQEAGIDHISMIKSLS